MEMQLVLITSQSAEFPMEWTSIAPVKYNQDVFKLKDLNQLKAKSQARVADNETFKLIMESAEFLKEQRELTAYPLNMERFKTTREELEQKSDKYDDILKPIEGLKVQNLQVDLPKIEVDESKKARNDDWLESIQKDIYIAETMAIMADMTGSSQVVAGQNNKEKPLCIVTERLH